MAYSYSATGNSGSHRAFVGPVRGQSGGNVQPASSTWAGSVANPQPRQLTCASLQCDCIDAYRCSMTATNHCSVTAMGPAPAFVDRPRGQPGDWLQVRPKNECSHDA